MLSPLESSREPYDIGDPPPRALRMRSATEIRGVLDKLFTLPEVRHSLYGLGADFYRQDGFETFTATRWFNGQYCLIYTHRSSDSSSWPSSQTHFILSKDGGLEKSAIYRDQTGIANNRSGPYQTITITLDEFLTRIAS